MSALSDGATHFSFKGEPDVLLFNAALESLNSRKLHHNGRSNDNNCIIVAKGRKVNILNEAGYKTGVPAFLFVIVKGVKGLELVFPVFKVRYISLG